VLFEDSFESTRLAGHELLLVGQDFIGFTEYPTAGVISGAGLRLNGRDWRDLMTENRFSADKRADMLSLSHSLWILHILSSTCDKAVSELCYHCLTPLNVQVVLTDRLYLLTTVRRAYLPLFATLPLPLPAALPLFACHASADRHTSTARPSKVKVLNGAIFTAIQQKHIDGLLGPAATRRLNPEKVLM
jgi:hypothetical protein